MWLTTQHGFISAVRDNQNPGQILLRFRSQAHADAFAKRLNDECGDPHGPYFLVRETPVADYRWKFSVPVEAFTQLVSDLAEETLEYDNFKGVCHHAPLMVQHERALFDTWHAWHRVQLDELDRGRARHREPRTTARADDFEDLAWPHGDREPQPAAKKKPAPKKTH